MKQVLLAQGQLLKFKKNIAVLLKQMQHPVISNVIGVGVLEMGFKLDLQLVACKMEGSRLNLKKFPGLVIRKIKPKGTILLFKSGKFIVVGAESEECGHVVSRKLCKDLQKILNIPAIKNKSFRISNIIAHGNLGYRVNISRIAQQPNAFKDDKSSGVFIRFGKVKCVIVFESGKIILNGATKFGDIEFSFETLVKQLQEYKLKNQEKTTNEKKKCNNEEKKYKKRKRKNVNQQNQQQEKDDGSQINQQQQQDGNQHIQQKLKIQDEQSRQDETSESKKERETPQVLKTNYEIQSKKDAKKVKKEYFEQKFDQQNQ